MNIPSMTIICNWHKNIWGSTLEWQWSSGELGESNFHTAEVWGQGKEAARSLSEASGLSQSEQSAVPTHEFSDCYFCFQGCSAFSRI